MDAGAQLAREGVGGFHGPSQSVGQGLNDPVRQYGRRLGIPCGSNDRRKDNADANQINDDDYRKQADASSYSEIVAQTDDR